MKIMVFLHGTTLMHKAAIGKSREERVRQVITREKSIFDFEQYVPVDNAVGKLQRWKAQGAELFYLSSHRKAEDVEKDKRVLQRHHFPLGQVLFRQREETYADVAEKVMPDILIEDDCQSIGGEVEMVYPHIKPELKTKIKAIVIPEFGGIDHLPDDTSEL